MSDTLRDRCLEAGTDAMGRSSSWRWWAPRHLIKLLDVWEPMIRADEAARHHDGGDCECTSAYEVRINKQCDCTGVRGGCDHD